MKYPRPLKQGTFLKRYKRFFADIEYGGEILTAHCPNTGSMKGCNQPGSLCLFSSHDDPKRKLKHTLEAIRAESGLGWVGINTSYPNLLAKEAFDQRLFSHWDRFDQAKAEAKINAQSRIDLVLWRSEHLKSGKSYTPQLLTDSDCPPLHFVEVKNVTLSDEKGGALFPDAVTERGQKHIRELMELMERGHSGEFLFVVQREDCTHFKPAKDIDPEYARLLSQAASKGLKITAAKCRFLEDSLVIDPEPLQVEF